MQYWPFWLGGLFLAAVPLVHWFLLSRMFAVSGRLSAITDALRGERRDDPQLAQDDLIRLLRAETASAFGEASCADEPALTSSAGGSTIIVPPTSTLAHLVFLVCVALGGTLAFWHSTGHLPSASGPDEAFHRLFGHGLGANLAVLLGGGVLVGFGTRMAGGCTSGHGLVGVSRLQPGSLVATACFFGCGIAVSFLLELVAR